MSFIYHFIIVHHRNHSLYTIRFGSHMQNLTATQMLVLTASRPHFHRKDLAICCRRITRTTAKSCHITGSRASTSSILNISLQTSCLLFLALMFFLSLSFFGTGKMQLLRTDIHSYINQPVSKRFRTYVTDIFNRNYSF